jgi:hypothetical protein
MSRQFYLLVLFLFSITLPAGVSLGNDSGYCAENSQFDATEDGAVDVLDLIRVVQCILSGQCDTGGL